MYILTGRQESQPSLGIWCLMRISVRHVPVDAKHHGHLTTHDKDHIT